jgi:hypothetical protein
MTFKVPVNILPSFRRIIMDEDTRIPAPIEHLWSPVKALWEKKQQRGLVRNGPAIFSGCSPATSL